MRRTAGLIAVLTVATATALGSGGAVTASTTGTRLAVLSRAEGFKAASSRMFHTDPSVFRLSSSKPVTVIVKLDYDPVASYGGGIPGLSPTSPSVAGDGVVV